MKFVVSSGALLKQLQSLGGVLNSNPALPILDCFLFEFDDKKLTIKASDLETTMTSSLILEMIDAEKSVAIPAKLLMDTLKTFPEQPLTFEINNETFLIEIVSDSGKYKLAGQNGEEFPRIPELEATSNVEMDAIVLASAINKTIFATGNDDLRRIMTGVLVELNKSDVTFVATDAHKLVRKKRFKI